jgi:hypothetical protein
MLTRPPIAAFFPSMTRRSQYDHRARSSRDSHATIDGSKFKAMRIGVATEAARCC